jgi:hypothetical protein
MKDKIIIDMNNKEFEQKVFDRADEIQLEMHKITKECITENQSYLDYTISYLITRIAKNEIILEELYNKKYSD